MCLKLRFPFRKVVFVSGNRVSVWEVGFDIGIAFAFQTRVPGFRRAFGIDFELAIAPLPRGNFRHYYFLIAQCLLSIFYLFCNLAIGAFGSYRGQRSSGALLHIGPYLVYC